MWPFKVTATPESGPYRDVQPQTGRSVENLSFESDMNTTSRRSVEQRNREKLERKEWTGYGDERLGIVFPLRALLLLGASFISGASLGVATGSSIAADRYRAENAHRLPTTQNGWFLYHKSKNYHAMLGGMKEGAKFGSVLTGWAFLFMVTEEVIDQSRARIFAREGEESAAGQRDAASTVISAMSVAGIYSWKQGFDQFAAARTARMALKYSVLFGLVQDALATLRGSRPAYMDWMLKKTPWYSTEMKIV